MYIYRQLCICLQCNHSVQLHSVTHILQVNTNGIITLDQPYPSYIAGPLPLVIIRRWIIAPYWANVDTRGTGQIFYRQTNDPSLLAEASSEIRAAFPEYQNITITNLFITTWDAVGYSPKQIDKVNYIYIKQNTTFVYYVDVLLEYLIS